MRKKLVFLTGVTFTLSSFVFFLISEERKYTYLYRKAQDCKCTQSNCIDKDLNSIKDLILIPSDEVIDDMNVDDLDEVYWLYVNTIQVLCHKQMKFGNILLDGGKQICLDDMYKPIQPCLVYSFGSNFNFRFEEAVIRHLNCEIHTFDPSRPIRGRTIPSGISFHLIGLSGENGINENGWDMKTLSTLRKILNHNERVIDILKIDIESDEWSALPEMLESGVLENVKQLCIEIHYNRLKGKHQLKTLRKLYEAGFRIFMHEHVPAGSRTLREPYLIMANLNELSLINTRWYISRE